jgi:hypothetical protein
MTDIDEQDFDTVAQLVAAVGPKAVLEILAVVARDKCAELESMRHNKATATEWRNFANRVQDFAGRINNPLPVKTNGASPRAGH